MSDVNNTVEKACAALQKSIKMLIREHSRYSESGITIEHKCERYVRHANHVLRMLVAKRTSLALALKAFEESSRDYVHKFSQLNFNHGDEQRRILTQWFAHFLRLRDGFQLLESGERRHIHDDDIDNARGKFQSRLSGALRKDGVTRKYKSELGYTGFGWDEFYDDDVGIRKHLLEALCELNSKRRKAESIISQWEDSAMDHHENERKSLNQQLNIIHQTFVSNMNRHLASRAAKKLVLVTDDKSERLTWGLIDIKRSGNRFAIPDSGGSLPIGMTLDGWKQKFSLEQPTESNEKKLQKPLNKSSTKRLVIEESSDEDGIETKKYAKIQRVSKSEDKYGGVEVRIREPTNVSNDVNEQNDNTSSVDEIKRRLGVSAKRLEEGRHQLDEENRISSIAACNDELREVIGDVFGSNDSGTSLEQCIRHWRELQRQKYPPLDYSIGEVNDELREAVTRWRNDGERLSRVRLKIAKGRVHENSDEAFSTREKSREAYMVLGNLFLQIHDILSTHMNNLRHNAKLFESSLLDQLSDCDHKFLTAAGELFEKSLKLVIEQQSCQSNLAQSLEKQWERGQLLLVRGRAQINIAISLLELSQCDANFENHREQPLLINSAICKFEDALKSASRLRDNTLVVHNHPDTKDSWKKLATKQNFEAAELIALINQQYGVCLWKAGLIDDAECKVLQAADTSDYSCRDGCGGVTNSEVAEAICNAHQSAMTLAQLSAQSLESLSPMKKIKGDTFLQITRRALERAREIRKILAGFIEKHSLENDQDFLLVYQGVLCSAALEEESDAVCELWMAKQTSIVTVNEAGILRTKEAESVDDIRGELRPDIRRNPAPSGERRIFVLGASSSLHRKRVTMKNCTSAKSVSEIFHSEFVEPAGAQHTRQHGNEGPIQFMPWGDECLNENDRTRYPACCPPLPADMPLDIRRAIEMRLGKL